MGKLTFYNLVGLFTGINNRFVYKYLNGMFNRMKPDKRVLRFVACYETRSFH